ncbi:MAG TPA: hypothetical protein VGI42_05230, partial [Chthoniobacterales bacterium]
ENDVAPVAKILKSFAAEFKIAALKIGVIDKSVLSTSEVEALADLPSREVLLSQLLGLLLAPATRLVRILNEPASAFARLLKAKGEKAEAALARAPAAEAPSASAAPGTAETPPPITSPDAPAPERKQEDVPAATAPPESGAPESPTTEVPA